jgi:carbonic anhydrase
MQRIDTIRQQLDNLLARIETDQQALAAEQAAVARATEALHESPALQAALSQGQELMRGRVLMLIDHQLGMIRESPTAVLLRALRRQVGEVE